MLFQSEPYVKNLGIPFSARPSPFERLQSIFERHFGRSRITIPLNVRESLGLQPGQKIHVILYENRIELIPAKPICEMRGFLKGLDTTITREDDRSQTQLS